MAKITKMTIMQNIDVISDTITDRTIGSIYEKVLPHPIKYNNDIS